MCGDHRPLLDGDVLDCERHDHSFFVIEVG